MQREKKHQFPSAAMSEQTSVSGSYFFARADGTLCISLCYFGHHIMSTPVPLIFTETRQNRSCATRQRSVRCRTMFAGSTPSVRSTPFTAGWSKTVVKKEHYERTFYRQKSTCFPMKAIRCSYTGCGICMWLDLAL